ncbi:uncharacterized protein F5891DRAFT_980996 [Suillus fuscotomentosus]|uniref:Uncharacterized protein n=1 Tax=Suillus fuscotomentosus TaxID=1912939 RepID=A0AAD4E6X2_9AGAM|nr:uncharacterized protein F5891DRAFT_980996 [Suillus fuscotomentosus]KAG1899463.1 hypothetical protein F5891DRAFT_980996 [Suillus fuscotomentosus]
MISAIFDGAHITVAGCLGAFFFKHTVVDRTSKAIKEAENVTAGLVISEFCISVAVLVLASNETTRILLSKDGQLPPKHDLAELNAPLICNKVSDFSTAADSISIAIEPCSTLPDLIISLNPISDDSYCTPPSTACSTLCMPISPTPLVQNTKRLSIDSDTTVVDHDDDFMTDLSGVDLEESNIPQNDSDCSRGSITLAPSNKITLLRSIVSPQRHQNLRPGRHKRESRSARLAAVRGSIERTHYKQQEHATAVDDLEQLHDDLLADQTALVDGWTVAMAQKTPDPGNLIEIIQDRHLHTQCYSRGPLRPNHENLQRPPSMSPTTWSFMPVGLKATAGRAQTMSSRRPVIPAVFDVGCPLRPIPTQPQPQQRNRLHLVSEHLELKATARGSHLHLSQVSSLVFAIM